MHRWLISAAVLALPCGALAQDPPPASAPAEQVAVAGPVTAAKNTLVTIALGEPLGSNTNKPGDKFVITLAEPLVIDGRVLLPAGTTGVGEVVHSAPSGLGGRSGELLLAARYLEADGVRIPLKGFQFAAVGRDTTMGSLWALGLVKGGQIIVPAGTRGTAKLAIDFTPTAAAAPAQP